MCKMVDRDPVEIPTAAQSAGVAGR